MGHKTIAYRIVLAQLGMALVAAAACWGLWGASTGTAVLAGGIDRGAHQSVRRRAVFGRGAVRPAPQVLRAVLLRPRP